MCARNRGFINRFASQQGITLMEVLISQALSLCILALAFGIGLAIERQNELLLVLSDLHAHSQIALQALEMEIQAAGFIGCPRLTADFPWAGAGVFPLTAANKLVVMPNALGGSVLTVWHRSRDAAFLEAPMTQPSVLSRSAWTPVGPRRMPQLRVAVGSLARNARQVSSAMLSRRSGSRTDVKRMTSMPVARASSVSAWHAA